MRVNAADAAVAALMGMLLQRKEALLASLGEGETESAKRAQSQLLATVQHVGAVQSFTRSAVPDNALANHSRHD